MKCVNEKYCEGENAKEYYVSDSQSGVGNWYYLCEFCVEELRNTGSTVVGNCDE